MGSQYNMIDHIVLNDSPSDWMALNMQIEEEQGISQSTSYIYDVVRLKLLGSIVADAAM